ncbi:hypothetical protein, partial [Escherichia coli]|uniref:hypothetical protein n=1 Tax=Escherichia coli TaxID=562 RepID=UPI0030C70B78
TTGRTGAVFNLQPPGCRGSRRPGALQQGGALYCACERQRATGATTHQAKSHPEKLPCNIHTM